MYKLSTILKVSGLPVVLASLCCLSPVILVLLGVSSVSFAASLADTLYGEYKWVFRGVGLVALFSSLAFYWYRQEGVCSLDAAKRRRNEIVNSLLLTLLVGVLGYLFFLYGVVHVLGVWLALWQ
jgi:hypothetical protein